MIISVEEDYGHETSVVDRGFQLFDAHLAYGKHGSIETGSCRWHIMVRLCHYINYPGIRACSCCGMVDLNDKCKRQW